MGCPVGWLGEGTYEIGITLVDWERNENPSVDCCSDAWSENGSADLGSPD